MIPAVWEEGNCAVTQLSVHLKLEPDYLEGLLDSVAQWREHGLVAQDLIKLAKLLK